MQKDTDENMHRFKFNQGLALIGLPADFGVSLAHEYTRLPAKKYFSGTLKILDQCSFEN